MKDLETKSCVFTATTFFHVRPMEMKLPGRSIRHGSGNIAMRDPILARYPSCMRFSFAVVGIGLSCLFTGSCARQKVDAATAEANAGPLEVTVGTVPVIAREMAEHLILSSELVPFQEIDVYAKEAGYVKDLYVDYGTHVQKGTVMAVLEIPEQIGRASCRVRE